MGLKDDLQSEVRTIFKSLWQEREGTVVPSEDSVKLANAAVKMKATVLYADLADSTKLVDGYKPHFAAEIYKTFLHCAAKIIKSEGGEITAYDGGFRWRGHQADRNPRCGVHRRWRRGNGLPGMRLLGAND